MTQTAETDRDRDGSGQVFQKIADNIRTVMRGQDPAIRKLLAAFAGGGHVLLEDVPGTGKTTLAKALAKSVDVKYKRVQFTPDLLPSDILGVSVYNQKDQDFIFHAGPVFTNVLLGDEINRASPRTQSALLEAMAESQVSIDGQLRPLPGLFFVLATQNPVEAHGTYPLPEAQMDRFAMRFSLGYVSAEDEASVLKDQNQGHPIDEVRPCVGIQDVLDLKAEVSRMRVSREMRQYMVDIVRNTRTVAGVQLGASPRASLALMKITQALALFDGTGFVTPDHVQEIAVAVIAHRMVMDPQAHFSGQTANGVVEEILKDLPAPV